MVFSFSFRLDTSDISSSFWVSSADLHKSSYNDKWKQMNKWKKNRSDYVVSIGNANNIGSNKDEADNNMYKAH